jgi:hypothetical protein
MIFDSLANSDNYREMHAIHLAPKYLKTLNPDNLPVQALELDGKSIDHHAIAYLHPGQFMVCFPEDAHMPGIMHEAPLQTSKILIKIAVQE